MKEGTPNIGAVCQRLAKHAPSGLSAEQIAYRLGRPYNTLMSELSPLRDTHKFDVNLLIPLMRLAGSTDRCTRWPAPSAGCTSTSSRCRTQRIRCMASAWPR